MRSYYTCAECNAQCKTVFATNRHEMIIIRIIVVPICRVRFETVATSRVRHGQIRVTEIHWEIAAKIFPLDERKILMLPSIV